MKLDLNLSPEPFQNRNLLYSGLILSAILALGFTAFNVWSVTSSWRKERAFMASRGKDQWDSAKAEEATDKLKAEIAELEKRPELAQVPFVNRQIERSSLSWIRLLDWMEATMPPAVILTSITPSMSERGTVDLTIRFRAKSLDAALAFMRRLRNTPAFPKVVPVTEATSSQGAGGIDFNVTAVYNPSAGPPPPPAKPKDDTGEEEPGEEEES